MLDRVLPVRLEAEDVDQADVKTLENARRHLIIGTPEECAEAIESRIAEGASKFQRWFVGFPALEGVGPFADEVIPQFNRSP